MSSDGNPTPSPSSPVDPDKYLVDHASTLGLSPEQIENLRPPVVIEGFIRRGNVLLLGAESKSRKSWMAMDAALSVVNGSPWLAGESGEGGFNTIKGRAHLFDLELDDGEIKFRFATTRGARFPESEEAKHVTADFFHYCLDELSAEKIMATIEACLPRIQPGDIVVLDCLYRLCPDGNDTEGVAEVLNMVKAWAKKTQGAWVLIDHFRKAGSDKARDRFNGSFIKQASPGCLVAIEVRKDGLFELQIDARSFSTDRCVWCRWDGEKYRFVRVLEADVAAAKADFFMSQMGGWLRALWEGSDHKTTFSAKEAATRWDVTTQGARDRFDKLEHGRLVRITRDRPKTVELTDTGLKHVQPQTGKPS